MDDKVTIIEEDIVDNGDEEVVVTLPKGIPVEEPTPATDFVEVRKKPSAIGRIGRLLIGTIDFEAIGNKLWDDIIAPNLLSTIEDALTTAISDILWSGRGNEKRNVRSGNTEYSSMYKKRQNNGGRTLYSDPSRNDSSPVGKLRGYGKPTNIRFRTQDDARETRAWILEQCGTYDQLTVGTYFDQLGLEVSDIDYVHGWRKLGRNSVVIAWDNSNPDAPWIVKLPTPIKLSSEIKFD